MLESLLGLIALFSGLVNPAPVLGDSGTINQLNPWKVSGGYVQVSSTTATLKVPSLNCTSFTNGGALTADASGVIGCSNDDGGGGAGTGFIVNATGTPGQVAEFSGTNSLRSTTSINVASLNATSSASIAQLTIGTLSGVLKATAGLISGGASTSDVPEGTNSYWTSARATTSVSSLIAGTTTTALAEGNNLYYTVLRWANALAGTTTDALREGSNNLYFTNQRARDIVSGAKGSLTVGTSTAWNDGELVYVKGDGNLNSVATTSVSCSGSTSCTSFTAIGSSPVTISSSAAASSTLLGDGNNWTGLNRFVNGIISVASSTFQSLNISGVSGVLKMSGNTVVGSASTSDVPEGTNSYWTSQRATTSVSSLIAGTTTTALAEGSNLYHTVQRVRDIISTAKGTFIVSTSTANTWSATQTFGDFSATNGTTTQFVATGQASTTALTSKTIRVGNLISCDTIDTDANGNFSCGTDTGGGGGTWPWSVLTNYNVSTNSTTSPMWWQGALYASSTVKFGNSTTEGFSWDSTNLRLGIGSTTPGASLVAGGRLIADHLIATSTTATSTVKWRFSVGTSTSNEINFMPDTVGTSTFTSGYGIDLTNGGCFAIGGVCVIDSINNAASSTLLADGNHWSGVQNFDGGFIARASSSVQSLCINGDCKTAWPSGGGVGSVVNATGTANMLAVFTGLNSLRGTSTPEAEYFTATGTTQSTFPFASTTAINARSICLDGDSCRTTWPTTSTGASTTLLADENHWSATQWFNGLVSLASSTLQTFFSTNATSSTLGLTGIGDGLLKTRSGSVVLATAGTDYETGLTAGDGLTRTVNDFDCDTASASVFGCLTSAFFTAFDNKISSTSLSAATPLSYNSGTGAFTIADAVANGSTKGAASFTANDFNDSSGNISIDYTNGTAASAIAKGFLTSTDWSFFNSFDNKVSSTSLKSGQLITYDSASGNISGSTSPSFAVLNATSSMTIGTLTGVLKAASGLVSAGADGTDYTLIDAITCSGTDKISAVTAAGVFTCSADVSGGGGTWPWTVGTQYNVAVNSTTTPTWYENGVFASSTSRFVDITGNSVIMLASSTLQIANLGSTSIKSFDSASSTLGVFLGGNGTTTNLYSSGQINSPWGNHTNLAVSGSSTVGSLNTSSSTLGTFLGGNGTTTNLNITAQLKSVWGNFTNIFSSGSTTLGSLDTSSSTIGKFLGGNGTTTSLSSGSIFGTLINGTSGYFATLLGIPSGTAPSTALSGAISLDTTDQQLLVGTSTTAGDNPLVFQGIQQIFTGTVASTSVDFVSGGRIALPPKRDGFVIREIHCYVDGGTSKVVNIDTLAGGANTDSVTCGTTNTKDTAMSANYVIAAETPMAIEFGATSGTVDYVTFSVWGNWVRK